MPHDDAMPHTDVPLPPPQPPQLPNKFTVRVGDTIMFNDVIGWGFHNGVFCCRQESGREWGFAVTAFAKIQIDPA